MKEGTTKQKVSCQPSLIPPVGEGGVADMSPGPAAPEASTESRGQAVKQDQGGMA